MTVINTYSPLSVASEAVGSFYDAKRKKEVEDAAAAYQKQRDARADMESDRTYKLAENKDTRETEAEHDTHALAPGKLEIQRGEIKKQGSDLVTAGIQQKIETQKLAYNSAMQPLQLEYQRLKNKAESGAIVTAADQHRLHQLDIQIKQVEATYASTMAQLKASLEQAEIARDNAETVRALRPPAGPKPSEPERDTASYNAAMNALSPLGRQFVDMLYGTNNQPTRGQAMSALQQARLPDADKQNVQTIIESKQSQFVTPSEQTNQAATAASRGATATREAGNTANTRGEQAYNAIAKGPVFDALTPYQKDLLHTAFVKNGATVAQAAQDIDSATGIPDTDKAAIKKALGAPSPQQGGGGLFGLF